jgi:hypothetical protein
MICGGLLGGALSSSQLGFVFLVSNSTGIGFMHNGIIANGIAYPWLGVSLEGSYWQVERVW